MAELCTKSPKDDLMKEDCINSRGNRLTRRQTIQPKKICAKEERNASIKKVSIILTH